MVKAYNALALSAQRSGSYGINQVVSNTLAAIFTATGRDIACVHESSWSVFEISAEEEIKIQATEHRKRRGLSIYSFIVIVIRLGINPKTCTDFQRKLLRYFVGAM